MTIIYPFYTQEVRDLAWACFSPPLMQMAALCGGDSAVTDCAFELTAQRRLWLEQLDRDASGLLAYLAQKPNHRLGIYFEQLWQFFLRQDPGVELVANNLPVQSPGGTLGEFDCIYFCHRRQRHVHLELAVKYFLGSPQGDPHEDSSATTVWLGPDTRDRLDKKIHHILHRQIQLSDHPEARDLLRESGIGDPLKEIAFKGQLFQPQADTLAVPPGYNPHCPCHQWLQLDAVAAYIAALDAASFVVLPKMQWLSAASGNAAGRTLDTGQLAGRLAEHFEDDSYPLLVATLDRYGMESGRFFVTDRDWPHR